MIKNEQQIEKELRRLALELVTTDNQGDVVRIKNTMRALFWVVGEKIELPA